MLKHENTEMQSWKSIQKKGRKRLTERNRGWATERGENGNLKTRSGKSFWTSSVEELRTQDTENRWQSRKVGVWSMKLPFNVLFYTAESIFSWYSLVSGKSWRALSASSIRLRPPSWNVDYLKPAGETIIPLEKTLKVRCSCVNEQGSLVSKVAVAYL